jgi:hypothetical protein
MNELKNEVKKEIKLSSKMTPDELQKTLEKIGGIKVETLSEEKKRYWKERRLSIIETIKKYIDEANQWSSYIHDDLVLELKEKKVKAKKVEEIKEIKEEIKETK